MFWITYGELFFIPVFCALIIFDFRTYTLPDYITLPLAGICLLFEILINTQQWFIPVGGAAACSLLLFIVGAVISKKMNQEAMGGGDIKLAISVGAVSGIMGGLFVITAAAISALIYYLITRKNTKISFGAFMSIVVIFVIIIKVFFPNIWGMVSLCV